MDSVPSEIIRIIMSWTDIMDTLKCRLISHQFNSIIIDKYFWQVKRWLFKDIGQGRLSSNRLYTNFATIQSIKNRVVHQKNIVRIQCINSYERRWWHCWAISYKLSHRSIIDYSQIRVTCQFQKIRDSGCCKDYDGIRVILTPNPYSYVEMNNGNDKLILGEEILKPYTSTPSQMKYDKIFLLRGQNPKRRRSLEFYL